MREICAIGCMEAKPKLLELVRREIRVRQYSIRTGKNYAAWIKRFILFHDKRHPLEMGADEVGAFLSHLANKRNVTASTQNQALSALLFLYRHVLDVDLPLLENVERARRSRRMPVVLTREEVRQVLRCRN